MIEVSRLTSSGGGGRHHQGETARGRRSGEGPIFDPSQPSGLSRHHRTRSGLSASGRQDRARTSSGTALPAGASIETVARWS